MRISSPSFVSLTDSDSLHLTRGFDFPEKEALDGFYPQYYHKCDKVRCSYSGLFNLDLINDRHMLGWSADIHRESR